MEVRTGRWERDARDAFLTAYFGDATAGFLPQAPANARRLLALFEIEKVFYELAYELNNRPDWKVLDNPFGNEDPIVLLPAILGYTWWSYSVFRGKVDQDGYH